MKLKSYALLLSFLFLYLTGQAQETRIIQSRFTILPEDGNRAINELYGEVSEKLFQAIIAGKIQVYSDKQLSAKLTPEEFITLASVTENIAWYDEDGTAKDTTVTFVQDAFEELNVQDKLIKCSLRANVFAFVKSNEAIKLLNSDERWLLSYIAPLNDGKLSNSDPDEAGPWLRQLNLIWYKLATEGKIKAYRSDSLKATYTPEEFRLIGSVQEEVMSDPDGDGEFSTYTVRSEFDTEQLSGLIIYCYLNYTRNGINLLPYAYGPAYQPIFGGIDLPYTPMFCMSPALAESQLTKDQKLLLQVLMAYSLKERMRYNVF